MNADACKNFVREWNLRLCSQPAGDWISVYISFVQEFQNSLVLYFNVKIIKTGNICMTKNCCPINEYAQNWLKAWAQKSHVLSLALNRLSGDCFGFYSFDYFKWNLHNIRPFYSIHCIYHSVDQMTSKKLAFTLIFKPITFLWITNNYLLFWIPTDGILYFQKWIFRLLLPIVSNLFNDDLFQKKFNFSCKKVQIIWHNKKHDWVFVGASSLDSTCYLIQFISTKLSNFLYLIWMIVFDAFFAIARKYIKAHWYQTAGP